MDKDTVASLQMGVRVTRKIMTASVDSDSSSVDDILRVLSDFKNNIFLPHYGRNTTLNIFYAMQTRLSDRGTMP